MLTRQASRDTEQEHLELKGKVKTRDNKLGV